MNLKEFYKIAKRPERERLAKLCGTSLQYLDLIKRGVRDPGPELARKLVMAEPRLTLQALRPDIWGPVSVTLEKVE